MVEEGRWLGPFSTEDGFQYWHDTNRGAEGLKVGGRCGEAGTPFERRALSKDGDSRGRDVLRQVRASGTTLWPRRTAAVLSPRASSWASWRTCRAKERTRRCEHDMLQVLNLLRVPSFSRTHDTGDT